MSSVLNPYLYERLVARFGRVKVARRGEVAIPQLATFQDGTSRLVPKHGEAYYISCPFCEETRQRLHISYLYGIHDPITGFANRRLLYCFNTSGGCTRDPYYADSFYIQMYGTLGQPLQTTDLPPAVARPAPQTVEPPGMIVRLRELLPNHAARQYVSNRDFDPDFLSDQYGVAYCVSSNPPYNAAQGRLIMPIVFRGVLHGWQGRYVGDINWKTSDVPKYYNYPYMAKSEVLYNFDVARNYPVIVLVEGVAKVWRVGPFSVAVLGSSVSPAQGLALAEALGTDGRLIVMVDGDCWYPSKSGDDATGPRLMESLARYVNPAQIAVIPLAKGAAPDDMDPEIIRTLISGTLQQRGWVVDFLNPRPAIHCGRAAPRRRVVPHPT